MKVDIREAKPKDFKRLEELLSQNSMLNSPEVDGCKAMKKVYEKMGKYFLIAEIDNYVVGMIRGCYDGSRAVIHQIAVDKKYQTRSIGKKMVYALALRFKSDGAPSISVTATKKTKKYYKELGFSYLPITLMVAFDINKVIKKSHVEVNKDEKS
jgi:N-acetylglutamate synthase-like GNAT family acetyltransferase